MARRLIIKGKLNVTIKRPICVPTIYREYAGAMFMAMINVAK